MRIALVAMAVVLLIGVGGCSTSGPRSVRNPDANPDAVLQAEIYNRLAEEADGFPSGLAIDVMDGVVTIHGSTANAAARAHAIAVIRSTPGVTEVVQGPR